MENTSAENKDWEHISYQYPILLAQLIAKKEFGRELSDDELSDITCELEEGFWQLTTEVIRKLSTEKTQV